MDDVKQFLYSWLGKNRKTPNYEVTSMNSKGKPRFKCELRVEGYAYIGIGNSTNKKSAQTNAAHDFCQYLARTGCMNPNEIPALKPEDVNEAPNPMSGGETLERSSSFSNMPRDQGNRGNFGGGRGGFHGGFSHNNLSREEAFRAADAKMLREAEDADVNCEIHGFWTLENAKSRLHQYLQMNKINTTYKFQSTGPDNQRSFFAEMSFYVPSINKKIHAMEHGSTKHIASKACALSLIRQLYHYNLVEAYTGERKKKELPKTATFAVEISDELRSKLVDTLTEFNITPVEDLDQEPPVSLLPDQKSNIFPDSEKTFGSTIAWSPPLVNWNPWSGCNIDEGSLATMSLTEISDQLYENQLSIKANRASRDVKNDLPVNSFRDQVLNEIDRNSVIIIRGHTGCGKTTQIPQFILEQYLEAKRGAECNIVVTQPRRISAVSVAERVANERFEELGESVGYSVRFESKLPRSYGSILFCTVGVLLRKLEAGLRGVSHVVVDEIHERDINTDFLLVLLNDMLSIYKDLKVVLMSATIDTALFSSYFGNCPIIEIYGRTFPVQEYFLEDIVQMCDYCPDSTALAKKRKKRNPGTSGADDDDDDDDDDMGGTGDDGEKEDRDVDCNTIVSNDYSEKTKNIMAQLSEKSIPFDMIECLLKYIRSLSIPGSVLVFLPGWNLIQSILKFLQQHPLFGSNQYILLPLHSQIPREDQYKVFLDAPPGKTKIILSTNIAESTITINDVVFVIDSCKVKQKIFTSRNNMTNYATIWASKSNLEQRKGRAGRVQSGFCFFLISRARYERLDPYATPEIFRTPLLELALSIKLLRLGDIREFLTKAMEPPPIDQVTEAIIALTEMHALDKNEELTPLGRILARLPIEPKMGKFIILGCIMNIGDAVCTIAAASTFSEPFVIETKYLRPMHRNYAGKRCSDHIALFMAFQQWLKAKWHGEQSEQEFCERKALNMQILRMTFEARNQLKDIMLFSGFPEESLYEETSSDISTMDNSDQSKLDTITSLLSYALYPNVCYHTEKRKLLTHEGKLALIHKNSVNCSHEIVGFPSPFFVFGEKIKTRAVSAKSMTMVSPVQLIVFGADRVEFSDGLVCLDGWINLKMDVKHAALLASLRLALDHVISICTTAPDTVTNKPRHIELFAQCVQTIADLFGNHVRIYKDGNDSQPTGFNNSFNNRLPSSSSNNLFNRGMGGGGYSNQMNPAKRFAPDHSMNMSSSFNRTFNRNVQGPPRSLMTGMSGNIGYSNQSNADDNVDDIPDQRETQLKQQISTPTSSRAETPSGNIPLPPHLLANSIGEARKFNDSSDNFGSNQQQNFRNSNFNNNFNNNFGNNSFGNRNRGFGNQGSRGGFNGSFRGSFRGGRGGFNNNRRF